MKTLIEKIQEDKQMTYEKLQELEDVSKARIIETTEEGTVQLWEVDGHLDKYVVCGDNSVMTQNEDNNFEDLAYFPL